MQKISRTLFDPEETFAALGMDPPPPTGQDGEA